MSNFAPKLEEANEKQLMQDIDEFNPSYGLLASDELTRRRLKELYETIRVFNEQSSKQSEIMIKLTWVIAVLTVAMLVGVAVQIYLTLCYK